jgi:hypothetical protein
MMQTPDGNGRLELVKFHSPSGQGDNGPTPANTPGINRRAGGADRLTPTDVRVRARISRRLYSGVRGLGPSRRPS